MANSTGNSKSLDTASLHGPELLAWGCTAITDACTIAKALQVSKSSKALILEKCAHSISMQLVPMCSFASNWVMFTHQCRWMRTYPQLVGSLQQKSAVHSPTLQVAEAYDAVVSIAGASALQPRELDLTLQQPAAFLQAIDTSQVTSLRLHLLCLHPADNRPWLRSTAVKLCSVHLPALRSLSLICDKYLECKDIEQYGQAVTQLHYLQQLHSDIQLPRATHELLPTTLQRLTLVGFQPSASISQLSALQRLKLINPVCSAASLVAAVGSLQQLQHLALHYQEAAWENPEIVHESLSGHASSWPNLAMLQELKLCLDNGFLQPHVAACIGATTKLTNLSCLFDDVEREEQFDRCLVDFSNMLAPLKHLRRLMIAFHGYKLEEGQQSGIGEALAGMQHLTVLSLPSFTFLGAYDIEQHVSTMTQLQELAISPEGIDEKTLQTVIAGLPKLQTLAVDVYHSELKWNSFHHLLKHGTHQVERVVLIDVQQFTEHDGSTYVLTPAGIFSEMKFKAATGAEAQRCPWFPHMKCLLW